MGLILFYTVADADGGKSRMEYPVDDEFIDNLTDVSTVVSDLWELINPLINGTLVTAGFSFETDISGFTNAAAAIIADVQEKARFNFRTVGGFLKSFSLPTFIETLFGGSGATGDVNLADTSVAAFTFAVGHGMPSPADPDNLVVFQDKHGDHLLPTVESAIEAWGKGRR